MRSPRELENRETALRPTSWKPPEMLPSPNKEDGWEFRWIRVSTLGESDPTNLSMKLREGWEFVKAADHPELKMFASRNGMFEGCVEVGGLVLAKTPTEFVQQRQAYYDNINKTQMESVDNSYFREFGPETQPFRERKTKVVSGFGSGKID